MQKHKHENMKGIIMKSYQFQEQLGEGTSARVYRATDNISHQEVAIKVIPKQYLNSDSKLMQLVKTQIMILKNCHNLNVVQCKEVFQSEKSIFIVLELCNGFDMERFLECRGRLQEDYAVMFLKQILNGFKGLHDMRVMHRDFKLANVLLNDQVCKIADLGYAKKFDQEQITYTRLGTKITMAPEVLECKGYSFNADIWSLGVVFYQMLYGRYPYFGQNEQDFLKKIKTKPIEFQNVRISKEARDFIQRCLTYNPKERINWPQIYTHPLINKDSMQIVYGIFNPVQNLEENLQFYQENSQEMELDYQNFGIMKSTVRKKLIIQQIQQTIGRDIESQGDFEVSNLISRNNAIMLGYAKQYVSYFNKLCFSFKFLRLELLQKSIVVQKNLEIESFLYIIFKKCIIQMKQFQKIVKKKINIFQINYLWQDFQASKYYNETRETVDYSLIKAQKILKKLQDFAVYSSIPDIKEEAKFCLLTSQQITELCQKYMYPVMKNLLQYFSKSQVNNEFLQFMEGLLYYLIKDDRGKILPQDFDYMMGRPVPFKDARDDLILRFQLFLQMDS